MGRGRRGPRPVNGSEITNSVSYTIACLQGSGSMFVDNFNANRSDDAIPSITVSDSLNNAEIIHAQSDSDNKLSLPTKSVANLKDNITMKEVGTVDLHSKKAIVEKKSPFCEATRSRSSPSHHDCSRKRYRSRLYRRNNRSCSIRENSMPVEESKESNNKGELVYLQYLQQSLNNETDDDVSSSCCGKIEEMISNDQDSMMSEISMSCSQEGGNDSFYFSSCQDGGNDSFDIYEEEVCAPSRSDSYRRTDRNRSRSRSRDRISSGHYRGDSYRRIGRSRSRSRRGRRRSSSRSNTHRVAELEDIGLSYITPLSSATSSSGPGSHAHFVPRKLVASLDAVTSSTSESSPSAQLNPQASPVATLPPRSTSFPSFPVERFSPEQSKEYQCLRIIPLTDTSRSDSTDKMISILEEHVPSFNTENRNWRKMRAYSVPSEASLSLRTSEDSIQCQVIGRISKKDFNQLYSCDESNQSRIVTIGVYDLCSLENAVAVDYRDRNDGRLSNSKSFAEFTLNLRKNYAVAVLTFSPGPDPVTVGFLVPSKKYKNNAQVLVMSTHSMKKCAANLHRILQVEVQFYSRIYESTVCNHANMDSLVFRLKALHGVYRGEIRQAELRISVTNSIAKQIGSTLVISQIYSAGEFNEILDLATFQVVSIEDGVEETFGELCTYLLSMKRFAQLQDGLGNAIIFLGRRSDQVVLYIGNKHEVVSAAVNKCQSRWRLIVASATKIQALIRRFKCKIDLPRQKEEAVQRKMNRDAASKLSCTIRGWLARKIYQKLRSSAIRIHAWWRSVYALSSRKRKRQASNRSRATAIAIVEAVSTPRDAPDQTQPTTAARSSSFPGVLEVVDPSKEFWERLPYSKEETLLRLKASLDDTDAYLRQQIGLSPNTQYSAEWIFQKIYRLIIEFVLVMHCYIVTECTNEDGLFVIRMLREFDRYVKGGYSISNALDIVFAKIGSAIGIYGIRGRTREQMPPGTDPNKYVGVFFTLDEIMDLLKSNKKLGQLADRIYELLPWTGSYNPYPREIVANHLVEIACGAILPGDTKFSGEWILYMGNLSVHKMVRRPLPSLNASTASKLNNTNHIKVMTTWPRLITHIKDQVTRGVTFDRRRLSDTDLQMVEAMLHLNPTFMQQFFIQDYLLGGHQTSVRVDKYVDAISRSPIDEEIARLACRARDALESPKDVDVQGLVQMLKDVLGKFWRDGESLYWLEQEIAGNPEQLAQGTAQLLEEWVADSITSEEKTVILTERTQRDALEKHRRDVFERFFGEGKLDECIYCIDIDGKRIAGHLYSILPNLKILVMGSYFIINAPGKPNETRQNLCQELITVKSTLAQADLVEDSAVNKVEQHLQAFMHQITHPISNEIATIRNNTPKEYHHGKPGKKGFQAMINIFEKELGLKGIHHEIMASFALHLGAVDLQRLFAVLGHEIDCSNITYTMNRLMRVQKDQGVIPTSQRRLSKETKQKISLTARLNRTEELKRKLSQAKTQLSEEMKAKRSKQYADYRNENESIPSGTLSSAAWNTIRTTWVVNLRQMYFGKYIHVGNFKQLCDATTAAMDYLDKILISRRKRENETFVNEVIQHVRSRFNACTRGRKWERSEMINILE